MGWISVDRHPDSKFIHPDSFESPFVYCINTSTKIIKIGHQTYSDWDDLDDIDFNNLRNNSPLSDTFNTTDIHKILGAGFHEECLVKLKDGRSISIADIKVNDILFNEQRVCGVVKLNGKNIVSGVNEKILFESNGIDKKKSLRCTGNIMVVDPELGSINTSDITSIEKDIFPRYVYHLLTDNGSFVVNDICVGDFNSSIENYLFPRTI